MSVSYKRLFHLMIERGISTSELKELAGFSANIMTRMKRNQYISLESIEKICNALECDSNDVLEFESEREDKNNEI